MRFPAHRSPCSRAGGTTVVESVERGCQGLESTDDVRRQRSSVASDSGQRQEAALPDELAPTFRTGRWGDRGCRSCAGPRDRTTAHRRRGAQRVAVRTRTRRWARGDPARSTPARGTPVRSPLPSDTASTSGTRTAPLSRNHASPVASVVKKPGGGAACVLANSTRPDSSSTRNAAAVSPPCTTDIAVTSSPIAPAMARARSDATTAIRRGRCV